MRKFFTAIFIVLIIPFVIVLFVTNKYGKDQSQLINKNILTNKIENKKEWSNENLQKINTRILKDQTIVQEFQSDHNNLGTIAVQFTNFQKINDDFVIFNISEKNTDKTIYENTYKVDQFNPDFPFTFGFPSIQNSKKQTYIFRIKSTKGTKEDSIGIASPKYFTTKYDFSVSTIKNKPINIFELLQINLSSLNQISQQPLNWILTTYFLIIFIIIFRKKIPIFPNKINNITVRLFPLILFIITVIISGYFATIGTDTHHDGIMLKPALDMAQGKMLYKETFTIYGGLSVILQSFAIKLFGEYLITIKLLTALFYGLIAISIYYIWAKFSNKYLAFFSVLIWIFLAPYYMLTLLPWSSVYALFFQCLTILFFQKYINSNSSKNLLFAGIMSALTFWCKQNVGLYTILGSIVSLFIIKFVLKQKTKILLQNIYKYIIGGIIISIPFFIWIIANGAFVDWWKQTIGYSSYWIKSNKPSKLFESYFPHAVGPISIWAISPIITILIIFKQLFVDKKKEILILIVCIFGIFSWLQYYPVTCIRHVYWAATPIIGVVIYFFYTQIFSDSSLHKHRLIKTLVFFAICALVFGPDITTRIQVGRQKIATKYVLLDNPKVLKHINLSTEEAAFYSNTYQEINNYIQRKGDTNLITIGANPLYLTFGKSTNFHQVYVNWASANESIYQEYPEIKDKYIAINKPLIISMWEQIPGGYCRVNKVVNPIDSAFLIIPCE